jgi:heme A synthase
VAAVLRRRGVWQPTVLFGLLTLEGALGVATLVQGEPLVLSIAHQVGAIFVLAAALTPAMEFAPPHVSGFAPAPTR